MSSIVTFPTSIRVWQKHAKAGHYCQFGRIACKKLNIKKTEFWDLEKSSFSTFEILRKIENEKIMKVEIGGSIF